jgi:hypothetical protein
MGTGSWKMKQPLNAQCRGSRESARRIRPLANREIDQGFGDRFSSLRRRRVVASRSSLLAANSRTNFSHWSFGNFASGSRNETKQRAWSREPRARWQGSNVGNQREEDRSKRSTPNVQFRRRWEFKSPRIGTLPSRKRAFCQLNQGSTMDLID